MNKIIDISGFRCTNHIHDKKKILSGIFDIHNPCSWCNNRENKGLSGSGPAFYYREYGHWEFPFIAEANCKNFSLIHTDHTEIIDPNTFSTANKIHENRIKIAKLDKMFFKHWMVFSFDEKTGIEEVDKSNSRIIYPNELNPGQFFSEASELRSEFFEVKMEILRFNKQIKKDWGIQNTQIGKWVGDLSKQMGLLTRQIDELESSSDEISLKTFSRWAMGGATGSATWDTLKWTRDLIFEVFKG